MPAPKLSSRAKTLLLAAVLAGTGLAVLRPQDLILYNPSASVASDLYVRDRSQPVHGSIVTIRSVDAAPDYAATRNFTDAGDRFLKRITAMEGDTVCAEGWARSDKRHFRIILAPEEGERLRDLTGYTRQVMAQAEAELGTRFSWVAVNHHDTGHAHTHIILRGRRANGQDLILPRDFIRHRLREIARDVATSWLGQRTPGQEREALERETTRHAPTRLDRLIAAQLPESQVIEVGRLEALNRDPHVTAALRVRTKELRRLGLAHEVRRGVLQFEPGWQDRLKAMELHLDIRKQLMAERQLAQQAERERLARRLSRSGLER